MSPTVTLPALGNSQLDLPSLLDFNLGYNPDFPLYVYAEPDSSTTKEIKMLEYVRAAHRVGRLVCGDSQPGEVIAIIANVDAIVYSALITGIMKAGLVPFPISPRNSPTALLHLIRKSSAHRVLMTQTTLRGVIDGLKAEIQMVDPTYVLSIEEVPSLQQAYPRLGQETAQDPFEPIKATFSPKDSDKAAYVHSSGSTGLPKPILLTHKIVKDDASLLFIQKIRENFSNPIMSGLGLPSFHMMAVCIHVFMPLYGLIPTAVFAPIVTQPDATPIIATPESILEAAQIIEPTLMLTVPTFFHSWAKSDKAVEFLRTLRCVQYGGGPLAPRIAESLISRGVHVVGVYGGTEFSIVSELRLDVDETWQYYKFRDETNIRMVPQGNGTYEVQFLTSEMHQVAVENLTDVAGYATSDTFEPHPTIPNLWKVVGRIDDVLVHSSGEKTVPAPLEAIISASPILSGSIMFGRQRDQPGILLEPLPEYQVDVNNDAEVSKSSRPVVEEANRIAPAFSRIFKEMILVVDPKKPLPRVGKGTVARKAAIALYDSEIDKLYETVDSNTGGNSVELPTSWNAMDLHSWLVDQISDILSTEAPPSAADLFDHGFDSLSSTILRLRLVGALRKSGFPSISTLITQNIVYNHPTITQLTEAISKMVIDPKEGANRVKTPEEAIEEMIAKYCKGLDAPLPVPGLQINPEQQYVLLTGSTGNLGAQILESLLRNESVAHVYTLNRPSSQSSMLDRHHARFQDKALDISLLSSPKLVLLAGETSRDDLGLAADVLNELRQNLTMIIHNAWRLDFNLSLASFESHVKGSRVLIDLARSSQHSSSMRFLFTSSIGSTQSWNAQTQGPYPEHVVMDAKYAVGGGYGESKYVTERVYIGQEWSTSNVIPYWSSYWCHCPNGAWATTDWVPIIVKSSLSLGILPDAYGVISWLPMDAVRDVLLDIGFSQDPAPIVVNVVHPKPISWTPVMQHIRGALLEAKGLPPDALPLVPYSNWVSAVEQYARNATDTGTQQMPAMKLLDFYRLQATADNALRKSEQNTTESVGLTPLSTYNIQRLSERARTLEPLDSFLVQKWVKYWIEAGF
ncbi:hypothetical protein BDP27DRAFT_1418094 [Rhodocollybia butyracea]|uniref:Polyketide synthase-like phosphopantetheine-binding domain-containing protein n=1 Tax=Rhodocollybia butyracea TaxID=206335 RepID=A0A9P5UAX3_9AGAR|nr:hypothetical protein BDP27DRAFT_1418094 [Rhodocollybia butyracea]